MKEKINNNKMNRKIKIIFFVILILLLVFFRFIGAFEEDFIGSFVPILFFSILLAIVFSFFIKWIDECKFIKGKIRIFFRFILNNWIKIAEIGTVIWAVNGILKEYSSGWSSRTIEYHITPIWAYFLSAVLILYLLRKYGKPNTPRT